MLVSLYAIVIVPLSIFRHRERIYYVFEPNRVISKRRDTVDVIEKYIVNGDLRDGRA